MWNKLFVTEVKDKPHLLLQAFFAVLFIALALWLLELSSGSIILWSAGAGALSSSCFIVFAMPHSPTSKASRIIRAYIIAILVGGFFGWLLQSLCPYFCSGASLVDQHLFWVSSALAVGISMVLMVLCGGEHPPAAGVCLVLVVDVRHWLVVVVIFGCACLLAFIHHFFAKHLRSYL